jgi:glycosyltransferase involved in cell wall biosynthesis
MPELISIIVPTYNRANLIGDTIRSIQRQTLDNWELIIVDDRSSDNTAEVVGDFCRSDRRISSALRPLTMKKGANSCRNYGLKLSAGRYIKWLDSDDMLNPDCLQKQTNIMSGGSFDVCFSQTGCFKVVDQKTIELDRIWGRIAPDKDPYEEYLRQSMKWASGSGLWRREFVGDMPFLEGLMNSQEWLMHLKYMLRNPKIAVIDEKLCMVRVHATNMSNTKNKSAEYFYHTCSAYLHAARLLHDSTAFSKSRMTILLKKFSWYHLFVFYKGGIRLGLQLLTAYLSFIKYLSHQNKQSDTKASPTFHLIQ